MAESLADRLRRLHEEATPGPWRHVEKGRVFNAKHLVTEGYVAYPRGHDSDEDDETPETRAAEALTERTGVIIATLRNALPALADLVEAGESTTCETCRGAGHISVRGYDEPVPCTDPLCRALAALRAALEEK